MYWDKKDQIDLIHKLGFCKKYSPFDDYNYWEKESEYLLRIKNTVYYIGRGTFTSQWSLRIVVDGSTILKEKEDLNVLLNRYIIRKIKLI